MRPLASAPGGRRLYDAYTAHHHLRAIAGQGVLVGVFVLNEYVLRKGLGGTRWHILALLLVPALAQSLAVFWNPVNPDRPLGRRPFRLVAMPVHVLLVLPALGLLPASPSALVLLLALCGATQAVMVPLQNGILARNYGADRRGRRFGLANALQALAIVVVSVPAGHLLDRAPDAWRWLYVLAAAAALFEYAHWSRLKRRRPPPLPAGTVEHRSPWAALRHDAPFRRFEACFMVYGLGFLMLQPVLPLFLVDELRVTYGQVGLARGAVFYLVTLCAAPFVGRLADRLGVLGVGALSFFLLAGFPLALLVVRGPGGLYVAYGLYGLAMSGVFLAWTVGPMLLARGREPLPYLNAHLGLVGFRALVGMVGATVLQQHVGSHGVFAVVAVLEVLAALGLLRLALAERRRPPGSGV